MGIDQNGDEPQGSADKKKNLPGLHNHTHGPTFLFPSKFTGKKPKSSVSSTELENGLLHYDRSIRDEWHTTDRRILSVALRNTVLSVVVVGVVGWCAWQQKRISELEAIVATRIEESQKPLEGRIERLETDSKQLAVALPAELRRESRDSFKEAIAQLETVLRLEFFNTVTNLNQRVKDDYNYHKLRWENHGTRIGKLEEEMNEISTTTVK